MMNNPQNSEHDEERAEFTRLNIERVEQTYLQATEDSSEDQVVILLDSRDETAQAIIAALPDLAVLPAEGNENPAVLFAMSTEDACDRLGAVNEQTRVFIEHAQNMRSMIDKERKLMMYLVISFALIECKLHPLPK